MFVLNRLLLILTPVDRFFEGEVQIRVEILGKIDWIRLPSSRKLYEAVRSVRTVVLDLYGHLEVFHLELWF